MEIDKLKINLQVGGWFNDLIITLGCWLLISVIPVLRRLRKAVAKVSRPQLEASLSNMVSSRPA